MGRVNSAGPRTMGVSRSLSNLHHTMLFTVVKLLLLPSALGLVVRFPPVQKVPEDAPKALSSDPESDAYIDQILANLATVIIENGLDPATLPDASAEFMGIGVSAGITANIADFGIYIDAEMDVANGGGLQLTNFAISHVGHIDIDVSGLGPLDWILELLVDFVDTFLKDWIVSLVEGPLKDLIQQILDDYVPDFPPAAAHI